MHCPAHCTTIDRTIGKMLLTGHIQGCKKYLIVMLAQAAAEKRLPEGFRLVQATSTFALTNHVQPGDVQDEHVQQQLAWASFMLGDIALDSSYPVNVVNQIYPAGVINASFEPTYQLIWVLRFRIAGQDVFQMDLILLKVQKKV